MSTQPNSLQTQQQQQTYTRQEKARLLAQKISQTYKTNTSINTTNIKNENENDENKPLLNKDEEKKENDKVRNFSSFPIFSDIF